MKWELIEKKIIVAPFVPKLENDTDVKYIDNEFKDMPLYSPED